jgi:hypothetical protein
MGNFGSLRRIILEELGVDAFLICGSSPITDSLTKEIKE